MSSSKNNELDDLSKLERRVSEIACLLEKAKLNDFVEIMTSKKRRFYLGLVEGLARGFGTAIGFTILGALAIYLLRQLLMLNLPIIGDFIAEIVKIVQDNL